MANKTTDMSKIRKVIKFYSDGKSKLFISSYLSLSRNTVKKYISLFEVLGLSFEIISEKTDAELELLFSQTTEGYLKQKYQKYTENDIKYRLSIFKNYFLTSNQKRDTIFVILVLLIFRKQESIGRVSPQKKQSF